MHQLAHHELTMGLNSSSSSSSSQKTGSNAGAMRLNAIEQVRYGALAASCVLTAACLVILLLLLSEDRFVEQVRYGVGSVVHADGSVSARGCHNPLFS